MYDPAELAFVTGIIKSQFIGLLCTLVTCQKVFFFIGIWFVF